MIKGNQEKNFKIEEIKGITPNNVNKEKKNQIPFCFYLQKALSLKGRDES